MAVVAAPALTWTGSVPPQSGAVEIPQEFNASHATGYPVVTAALGVGPTLSDWVASSGGHSAHPIG